MDDISRPPEHQDRPAFLAATADGGAFASAGGGSDERAGAGSERQIRREPQMRNGPESDAEPEPPADSDEVPELTDPDELARIVLGLMLVSREPISRMRLAQVCNASQRAVDAALERLGQTLAAAGLPIEVSGVGGSVRLLTLPELYPYLLRLRGARKVDRLSPAALETLAVVAYRQPVIRAEIEAIRGVKVGPTLRTLLDHGLVGVTGRADVPGRPLQYGTTQLFLDRFGLASLDDLPSVKELEAL